MSTIPLTMAISHYAHVQPIISGQVQIAGTDPVFFELPIPEMFRRFVNYQEWEASEMSAAQYISRRAMGERRIIALPIFTSRLFRHTAIIVRKDRIREPGDLVGARVGTPEWTTTAGVYARGMLSDMYGIKPADMYWFQGGLDRPGRAEAVVPPFLSKDVRLTSVTDRSLEEMLWVGDIDAIIAPQFPPGLRRASETADGLVGRLFDEPIPAEQAYFDKTGVFPIMHLVALRSEFYERYPWVASNLYRAFEVAKRRCFARFADVSASRSPLPWIEGHLDRVRERFGPDLWPYGLEKNRHVLETLVRYERDQGLISGDFDVEEHFAPVEPFVDGM